MSGKYNGLQAKIKTHVPSALFIPCSNHSLNLVGNAAAESCSESIQYFQFVQNLFNFFSSSNQRWGVLKRCLENSEKSATLKKLSDTRWSSRADAIHALRLNYEQISEALVIIIEDPVQKKINKVEATALRDKLCLYETRLLTSLWNPVLHRINATNLSLQNINLNILKAYSLLKSCQTFIKEIRNNYDSVEEMACSLLKEEDQENRYRRDCTRIKKRNLRPFFDEKIENEIHMNGREYFNCKVFNVICDNLICEIETRSQSYFNILRYYKIFFDENLTKEEVKECTDHLLKLYKNDIDSKVFENELTQFLCFCKEEKVIGPSDMYSLIFNFGIQSTFPNVEIILRIFLTVPLSNASGERSFSALKRIKNYLRNSLSQEHLSSLAILNIESEELNNINYNDIIDKFAADKARRKLL